MYFYIAKLSLLFICFLIIAGGVYARPAPVEKTAIDSRLKHHITELTSRAHTRETLVTVILESDSIPSSVLDNIKRDKGVVRYKSGNKRELQMPASRLATLLDTLPTNTHVRLPYPHQAVSVTSQGVAITGAADMQSLGNGGEDVKVGVIDLGFSSYTNSQLSGDLPMGLSIVDYTGSGTGGINHGTNVAEIVHDMAPGAELYLAKVGTTLQLEQAVNDMLAAGVKIINHSVAWFGAAFYDGTGPLCDITNTANINGMLWVNAMGNSRNAHYMANFSDVNGNLKHQFSTDKDYNTINLNAGKSVTLILNWDAYPSTDIDYDLYLYNGDPDSGGTVVDSSTTEQTGRRNGPQPYEVITYTAPVTGTYYIVVKKENSSTSDIRFSLFSTGPSLGTRVTSTSLTQPADCDSAISVGATNLTDLAESFSSEGPTTDGRDKPEVSAPNRVITSLSSSFAGTSGAAPHVAGAAALILSKNNLLSVNQLRDSLITTSYDVASTNYDYRTGFGRISLDADDDGYNHDLDNCVLSVNLDQLDTDLDAQGNVCDLDDDNDGLVDTLELLIGSDVLLVDTDGDGLSDYFEVAFDGDVTTYESGLDLNPLLVDSDGDTLSDLDEIAWDGDSTSYILGSDLNPLSFDSDNDGFADASDPIPLDFNYADGDVAPLGSPDGVVNIADYVVYQRIIQQTLLPTASEYGHGDIYPVNAPDGVVDLSDLQLLQKMILQ